MKKQLPHILSLSTVAKSRLFEIQAVDLKFSNGIDRTYERFRPFNRDSVMVAKKWTFLRTMKINPQIMGHKMHVLLGEDLYPNQLEGDEPEPLEIVRYPLSQLDALLISDEFNEARNLTTLYTLRDYLKKRK